MASFATPENTALSPEDRMNLTALQRRDPYIVRVIETASQVALYDYDTSSDAWTNTDVEGSLFVYERVVAPNHGFTISNRKRPNNHWEALNEHVEFQNPEDNHFLLYKNREKIFGIWFFDQAECRKIGDLARQLVLKTTSTTSSAASSVTGPDNAGLNDTATGKHGIMKDILSSSTSTTSSGGGDIISLLFKAQHEYNQGGSNGSSNPGQSAAVPASPSTKQPINKNNTTTQTRGPIIQQQQQPLQLQLPSSLQQQLPPLMIPSPQQQQQQQQQPSPPHPHLNPAPIQPTTDGPKSISLSSLFANAKSQQQQQQQQQLQLKQQQQIREKAEAKGCLPPSMTGPPCVPNGPMMAQNIASMPAHIAASMPAQIAASMPAQIAASMPAQISAAMPAQITAPMPAQITASMPVPISAAFSGPPHVDIAPIAGPIVGCSPTLGKPAFTPLDDDGGEQNALQLFVQKMKIQDEKNQKDNPKENEIRALPLKIDGGFGVASRRRKESQPQKKLHRNSVPSHSPPSIEKLPQIPLHFTNSHSSGLGPSSDSPSPPSPLPEKPVSVSAEIALLAPDVFEYPPSSVPAGGVTGAQKRHSNGDGWTTSLASNDKCGGGGGVTAHLASSLLRNSLVLSSDDDVVLEQNSSDDVFGNDDSDDVSSGTGGGGGGYAIGGRRSGKISGEPDQAVAGLTKDQLKATLVYLLQSDNDFLESIHAGYVASLKAPKTSKRHGKKKK